MESDTKQGAPCWRSSLQTDSETPDKDLPVTLSRARKPFNYLSNRCQCQQTKSFIRVPVTIFDFFRFPKGRKINFNLKSRSRSICMLQRGACCTSSEAINGSRRAEEEKTIIEVVVVCIA